MSGLLALLDDVAALTKLAATQIDDIAVKAAKAGSKAAGVVIDDSAVTPKYVHGLPAARELPIVWQIARGSLFNKMVVLLPAALAINAWAPWLLAPLLMIGGAYLCFEGAEKVWHMIVPHSEHQAQPTSLDAAHLERERVAGAIKTDFVLSAEIMAIALAGVAGSSLLTAALALTVVAVAITVLVYGSVALLVKADDIGLAMSEPGRPETSRAIGRAIVKAMPAVLDFISAVGTLAMLWVGGSIVIHSLKTLGWGGLYDLIHAAAAKVGAALPAVSGLAEWVVAASLDGLVGLAIGIALIPLASHVLVPLHARWKAGRPT
jgi:hypothetical protein